MMLRAIVLFFFLHVRITALDLSCYVHNRSDHTIFCRSSANLPERNYFQIKYIYLVQDLTIDTHEHYSKLVKVSKHCDRACDVARPPQPCSQSENHGCKCGWTFYNVTNSCYRVMRTAIGYTFDEAERDCVLRGGDLTSIHSSEENEFLAHLSGTGKRFQMQEHAWIGLYRDHLSKLKWIDGTEVDYQIWWDSQPDNFNGTEGCIQLRNWKQSIEQRWNDVNCERRMKKYICRASPIILDDEE
ncbi:unnamed protein product [Auanema sp. JU1783]|nr:unnamed protein product [Auanema sp. JU1783]